MANKRILVAPLNWGLGHATRCIPIIEELIKQGFEPVLASDGAALSLLQKEFSTLKIEELPSYNIEYPEDGNSFRRKLIASLPKIKKAIAEEKKLVPFLIEKYDLKGIISDNRLGIRHSQVPSVIITHQLNVLTGKTTILSSLIHQHYIRKFDECWIPDIKSKKSLSGRLGSKKNRCKNAKWIGALSRFEFFDFEKRYDILVILSGPEPQREILEHILLEQFSSSEKKILFVRGVVEDMQSSEIIGNMKIYNFLLTHQLENALNYSEIVIARSGYSTIMDLAKLNKKAFFIPTPGQFEQEYLARRFSKLKIAPYCNQYDFKIENLEELKTTTGFFGFNFPGSLAKHFSLFQRE